MDKGGHLELTEGRAVAENIYEKAHLAGTISNDPGRG